MKDTRKRSGTLAETVAAAYLTDKGVRILQRNFRCRFGEIDLIGWDGTAYLIVEVKFRSSAGQGEPAEAVDFRKQHRICLAFDYFRMKEHLDDYVPVRFDVIEIDRYQRCHWIRNAFEYHGL